jgi:membrane protein required for colicin V production
METYDIIMLTLLGVATLYGALKGLAWQIASLASLVLSYLAAYKFRGELAAKIDATPPWNIFLAMLMLYAATSAVIWLLSAAVSATIDRWKFRDFDRQLGALAGFVKGVLFCVVVTLFVVTLLGETARQSVVRSKSGAYIARLLHDTDSIMPPEIKSVLAPHIARLNAELDPNRRPDTVLDESRGGEPRVAVGDLGAAWDKILPRPRPGALDLRRGAGAEGSGVGAENAGDGGGADGEARDAGRGEASRGLGAWNGDGSQGDRSGPSGPISPYGRRPF